jgi:hypothetical protein
VGGDARSNTKVKGGLSEEYRMGDQDLARSLRGGIGEELVVSDPEVRLVMSGGC